MHIVISYIIFLLVYNYYYLLYSQQVQLLAVQSLSI